MKSIIISILILIGFVGCSSINDTDHVLPPEYISFSAPLQSEQGQVTLSCVRYWSEDYINDMKDGPKLRFVPFSEQQIVEVQQLFAHTLASGARAEVRIQAGPQDRRLRTIHIADKDTGEEGIAVGVRGVALTGNSQASVILETMYHFGPSGLMFKLVKTNANWQVISYTNMYSSDVSWN